MRPVRRRAAALLAFVLWLAPGSAHPDDPATQRLEGEMRCDAAARYPEADWQSAAERVRALRPGEVAALDAYAFTLAGRDADRRGIRTDGLVVIHRGVITYERYGRGFGPGVPHLAWSASKTVVQALVGVAVARGVLSTEDSICKHLPAAAPAHCGITVRSLMESASGLDWSEAYEGLGLQASSVLAMLYGEGRGDMAAFVLSHRQIAPPRARWNYSSGDAVLLAAVVDRAMVKAGAGADWPFRLLFEPLGLLSATLERDAAGTPIGSSYFYATPRDLARIGWLYAQEGCWRGKRLLPRGWVEAATEVSGAFQGSGGGVRSRSEGAYGWDLWLNRRVPELGWTLLPWPGVPGDAFAARGHWGQEIVIIPSLEMVVVRTGDDREHALQLGKLLPLAIAAGRVP